MTVVAHSGGGRGRRLAAVVVLLLLAGLLGASSTRANELAYRGCITGDRALGPSGSGACVEIQNAGLNPVLAVALSPDGRSLYTAGYVEGATYAIARFDRDPATGALAYRGCIADHKASVRSGSSTCEVIPGVEPDPAAPLYGVRGLTVSPDGNSVYAVGLFSLVRFDRDPTTGVLAYRGCITGATRGGVRSCDEIPTANLGGDGSGMGASSGVAVSPGGNSVYVTSPIPMDGPDGDAAIALFDRDPGSGALTWHGCISGRTELGPAGNGACTLVPSASRYALDSGFNPESLSLSPDGESLYTGSSRGCDEYGCWGSWGLARFDRDPATGALTYRDCITGDRQSGPSSSGACAAIPSASQDGKGSGLRGYALAASPDGKSLYAGGGSEVSWLDRDPTGALTYGGCITGDRQSGPSGSGACAAIRSATKHGSHSGLSGRALAASPDGKTLYAGGGSQVARLRRDPATGALEFRNCVTGGKRSGPSGSGACALIPTATRRGGDSGLGGITALAPSQDGASLYSASGWGSDGSVARFGFAPQTRITKGRTRRHRAVFHFSAGKPSSFECKLKGKRVKPRLRHWRHCGSKAPSHRGTVRYHKLRRGRKVIRIRASDGVGNTDPTPAKRRWRVQ